MNSLVRSVQASIDRLLVIDDEWSPVNSKLLMPKKHAAMAYRWLQHEAELEDDDDVSTLDRWLGILSNVLLFLLIFGLSATVDFKEVKVQVKNFRGWVTGATLQFVVMPITGFAMLKLFRLPVETGIALLVITSSPGGTLSNWWCATCNADLALSVTLTAISSSLAVGFLPLNLYWSTRAAYETEQNAVDALDFGLLMVSLAIIIGAIVSGTMSGIYLDSIRYRKCMYHIASATGLVLIVLAFFLSNQGSDTANTKLWNQEPEVYAATILPCVIGITVANLVSFYIKLKPAERMTVSIEVCYQNTLVGISVAINMFSDKDVRARAVAVPILYGVFAAFVTCIYCLSAWKMGWSNAPSTDNLLTVLTKLYTNDSRDATTDRANIESNQMESVPIDGIVDKS